MNGTARMCAALRRELPDRIPTFEWFLDAGVGRALTGSGDPLDIVERLDLDGINIRPDYARRLRTRRPSRMNGAPAAASPATAFRPSSRNRSRT